MDHMKWCVWPVVFSFIYFAATGYKLLAPFAGGGVGAGDGGLQLPAAATNADNGGAFDKYGNFYFAEILGCRIRKVTPSGIITTVAGTGACGFSSDGGPATSSKLLQPTAVLLDSAGNMYIDDEGSFRIRKVEMPLPG